MLDIRTYSVFLLLITMFRRYLIIILVEIIIVMMMYHDDYCDDQFFFIAVINFVMNIEAMIFVMLVLMTIAILINLTTDDDAHP